MIKKAIKKYRFIALIVYYIGFNYFKLVYNYKSLNFLKYTKTEENIAYYYGIAVYKVIYNNI